MWYFFHWPAGFILHMLSVERYYKDYRLSIYLLVGHF